MDIDSQKILSISISKKKKKILKASSHPHTHKIYMQVMQLKLDGMNYNRKVYVCRNERERRKEFVFLKIY